MNTERICEQCRQPLPVNAPEGLCPACLAKMALGSVPAGSSATINVSPLAEAAPATRVPPKPADLAAQFPQLEILELLGMGGMGMVYKARQPRLDRFVALKILPVESAQHPYFAERFNREAKALAKLNHPGIVDIYDFGQTGQYYYFVMEYVDGMNLRQLLKTQALEPRQALELVTQICTALQYAHDEGVVHRDIKPENILLNKKGQVKIADFGLAKLLGTAPDTALTMSQAAMGTFNYMAPEQRENAQKVDHRADIYSLGVVFYEMLTGEVPMGRFEPPSKKVQVDVRLDEVVLHALEREPARRYQHVSEVKSGVESITSTPPAASPAPPTTPYAQPRLSRTALVGAAWAFGFLLFALFSLFIVAFSAFPDGTRAGTASQVVKLLVFRWGTATYSYTPWLDKLWELTLISVGLTAPFGTTILGYQAVSQIRYSAGALYGLGLAVFDGLLFPLLVVDSMAGLGVFVPYVINQRAHVNTAIILPTVVSLLVSIALDFFIVRKVWRICRRKTENQGVVTSAL